MILNIKRNNLLSPGKMRVTNGLPAGQQLLNLKFIFISSRMIIIHFFSKFQDGRKESFFYHLQPFC